MNYAERKATHGSRSLLRNSRPGRTAPLCTLHRVFRRSLETIAAAAGSIAEYHLSRSSGLRAFGCRSKRLHHRTDGSRHCRLDGSSENFVGPSFGSLDGWEDRIVLDANLSGAGEEL